MIRFVLHLVTYGYSLLYTSKLKQQYWFITWYGLSTYSKAGKNILILRMLTIVIHLHFQISFFILNIISCNYSHACKKLLAISLYKPYDVKLSSTTSSKLKENIGRIFLFTLYHKHLIYSNLRWTRFWHSIQLTHLEH